VHSYVLSNTPPPAPQRTLLAVTTRCVWQLGQRHFCCCAQQVDGCSEVWRAAGGRPGAAATGTGWYTDALMLAPAAAGAFGGHHCRLGEVAAAALLHVAVFAHSVYQLGRSTAHSLLALVISNPWWFPVGSIATCLWAWGRTLGASSATVLLVHSIRQSECVCNDNTDQAPCWQVAAGPVIALSSTFRHCACKLMA